MPANQLKWSRVVVILLLVLLAIEFEFGMEVNLSALPSLSPFALSFPNVLNALNQAGTLAVAHATVGTVLTIVSLISLILAMSSKNSRVQIFGVLGFLSMVLAEVSGVLFVTSGYQNNNLSRGMATGFILTFALYFIVLYCL